jgi:hypothetical protein
MARRTANWNTWVQPKTLPAEAGGGEGFSEYQRLRPGEGGTRYVDEAFRHHYEKY